MNKTYSRIVRLIIAVALSLAMALTPICTYAAPQQQKNAVVDAVAVNKAIANKDYNYIISVFFEYYGNYFRQHHRDANFPYFNATEYMKKYPDVAAACANDPNKALEHYIAHGASEGRSGCGKYDIVKFLKKYPETVLSAEFTNNIATPEVYFATVQPKIEIANSSGGTQLAGGGGGGSSKGGGSPYTPTPRNKSVTFMYYCCGSNLETKSGLMSRSVIDSMLAAYKSTNVNLLMCLGGADKWPDGYLADLLNYRDGDVENRTGYFAVNIEKMNAAIEDVAKNSPWDPEDLYEALIKGDDYSTVLYTDLKNKLFTDEVLSQYAGAVYNDKPMYKADTLGMLLEEGKENYPADEYVLVFNSHGGGAFGGVGSYDRTNYTEQDTVLAPDEIAEALDLYGYNDSAKLSFLAFDACLMGGVEVAATLKANYSYMYASEASQNGNIDYHGMVLTAVENGTVDDLGYAMAYKIFESRYKGNSYQGNIQTSALFSSKAAQNAIDAVDAWAAAMVKLGGYSPKEMYLAMKKATIYSYQISGATARNDNYGYYDTRDYLEQLKKILNSEGKHECDEAIDNAIDAVTEFIVDNCYNYDGKYIFNSANGGVVVENRTFWEKYLCYNLAGGTIMIPDHSLIGARPFESTEADEDSRTYAMSCVRDNYCKKYNGLDLGTFTKLLCDYTAHFTSQNEYDRVRRMAADMLEYSASTPSEYNRFTNVVIDEEGEAIRITINQYAEKPTEDYSGDAFLDIIDTISQFRVYLARKLTYVKKTQSTDTVEIDVIIGSYDLPYTNMDGVHNSVKALTTHILTSSSIFVPTGKYSDGKEQKQYLNIITAAETNTQDNKKTLILQTSGINEELDAKNARIAELQAMGSRTVDEEKELTTLKSEREGILSNLYDKTVIYEGYSKGNVDQTQKKVLLLFVKNDKDVYTYKNAYTINTTQSGPDTYTLNADVKSVYFGHSYVKNVDSDDAIAAIETSEYDYENYANDYDSYWYTVAEYDAAGKITETYAITLEESTAYDGDSNAQNYGYYMTVITYDGKLVDLNDDDEAVEGNNYSGPIVDPNYVPPASDQSQSIQQDQNQDGPKMSKEYSAENAFSKDSGAETASTETPTTTEPEITPVQAVIEEKGTTDESAKILDNVA